MYKDTFSLTNFLQALWRWGYFIILVAIVLTGASIGFSLLQTPTYQSSIKLLIGQEDAIVATPSDATGLQQLTLTMAEGVGTRPIAEAVIRQEGLRISPRDLLDNLSVEQVGATQFIQVTYEDSSPTTAQRVANAVGEVFSNKVSGASSTGNAVSATVWERAALPSEPVSPDPVRNGLLTLVAALMLGVGMALLLQLLDDGWHSPEEVEQITGVLTIGAIPQGSTAKETRMMRVLRKLGLPRATKIAKYERNEQAGHLVTILDPMSAASEAYRTLRTNLLYASVDDPPKVVVVTSPGPGEGKTNVCSNLGVVLAQTGKNTLIVDCDFRKPAVHKFFGVRNLYGLGDILIGELGPKEVWIEPLANLKVISVGPIPPNPTELLDSQRFADFLASMRHEFEYVLIDSAPVSSVSDAAMLASRSDGILLVVDAQYTRKTSVRQAMRSLAPVGATLHGTVINNAKDQEGNHHHTPYSY